MEAPTHPFLIDVILQNIFKSMAFDVKNFSNYRLVCKTWNDASLKIWRQNVWVKIQNENYPHVLKTVNSEETELSKYPFKMCITDGLHFHSKGKKGTESLKFWEKLGSKMTHLHIRSSTFYGADIFRHILFQSTPNLKLLHLNYNTYQLVDDLPVDAASRLDLDRLLQHLLKPHQVQNNLKELKIDAEILEDDDDDDNGSGRVDFPVSWMELLIHFPSIEYLKASGFGDKGMDKAAEILKATEIVRKKYPGHDVLHLKTLDLEQIRGDSPDPAVYKFPPGMVSSLRRLHLPLQTLSLDIGFEVGARERDVCKQLLKMHADSLEFLYLSKFGENNSRFTLFPVNLRLEKLTKLKLNGLAFENLLFLKQLPNLKTLLLILDLDPVDDDDGLCLRHTRFNGFTHESLEKFEVDNLILNAKSVRRLGKLVPNLKKLRIGLENDGFTRLCRTWKTLESLTIHPFLVSERGFLGIEGVERFSHPNITDLQHLKFFGMGDKAVYVSEKRITSSSILHGILSLNKLEDAQIRLNSNVEESLSNLLQTLFPMCLFHERSLDSLYLDDF